jgi:hypothetical protein
MAKKEIGAEAALASLPRDPARLRFQPGRSYRLQVARVFKEPKTRASGTGAVMEHSSR